MANCFVLIACILFTYCHYVSLAAYCTLGSGPHTYHCTISSEDGILNDLSDITGPVKTMFLNNSGIRNIEGTQLHTMNIFYTLHHLYLNDNKLERIEYDWFEMLRTLISIDLSGNQITEIDEIAFEISPNLRSINLSRNQIKKFHYTGNGLQNKMLDLSFNPLVDFKIGKVGDLHLNHTNLQHLHLPESVVNVYASFSKIETFSFGNTKNLKVLDLHSNNISSIKNLTNFEEGGGPTYLDLSENYFGSIDPNILLKLSNLVHLNLSKTVILNLYYGTFWNQKDLKVLDLSNNHLWNFNSNKIYPARLDELYLHNNAIYQFEDERHVMLGIKKLGIAGNGLICSKLFKLYLNARGKGVEFYMPDYLANHYKDNVGGMACYEEH